MLALLRLVALTVAIAMAPGPRPVPPVSWTCPMHADVVEGKPGACPICRMTLVPVRLDFVWSCPVHSEVTAFEGGRCRICGRDLVRVIKAVTFTCRVHRTVDRPDPGACPVCGRPLVAKYSRRPHGDHNPKHGGQFFMASNDRHVEITHPSASLFRLYVYDEYSRPAVPLGLSARIVTAPGRDGRPVDVSVPFTRAGSMFDARIPGLAVPATIAIKIRFEAGDREYRFDLPFYDYSKTPARGR